MGVTTFGKKNMIFLYPGVKINGTYWWLSSYCLSCVRSLVSSLSSSKTVLLHTGLVRQSAFWHGRHHHLLHQNCGPQQSGTDPGWYGVKCSNVHQTKVHNLDELKQHLVDVWHGFGQSIIDVQLMSSGRSPCMYSYETSTFQAFALTQGKAYNNFSVLSLWTLKGNWCYWVKYASCLLFFTFWIK